MFIVITKITKLFATQFYDLSYGEDYNIQLPEPRTSKSNESYQIITYDEFSKYAVTLC